MPQRWRRRLRHHFWRPEAFRAELARLTSRDGPAGAAACRAQLIERLDPDRAGGGRRPSSPTYLDAIRIGADRRAHAARDRRAPAGRGRRRARDAAGAADGGADRELRRHHGAGPRRRPPDRGPACVPTSSTWAARSTPSGAASTCSRRPASPRPAATFSAEFGRNLEYYTGFVFEIVRAQARAEEPDRRRRPLRQPARRRRRRRPPCRPSAPAIHTERLLAVLSGGGAMSDKLILALPSKGRLMEQCAGMLAQGRAGRDASRARRAATRARSPACRTSRSTSSRRPRSPSSSRTARRTSASPARTCCARRSPIATSASPSCAPLRLRPCRRGGGRARLLDRRAAHGRPGGDGARASAACTAAACASPPST